MKCECCDDELLIYEEKEGETMCSICAEVDKRIKAGLEDIKAGRVGHDDVISVFEYDGEKETITFETWGEENEV